MEIFGLSFLNKTRYILLFFIVLLVGIVCTEKIKHNRFKEESEKAIDKKTREYFVERDLLKEALFSTLNFNSELIPNIQVSSSNFEIKKAWDILGKYHFNLWAHSYHCLECVKSALINVKKFMESHPDIDFSIITNFGNRREILLIVKEIQIQVDVWFYDDNISIFPNSLNPAFFVLHLNGNVEGFFSPFKELPQLTEDYLSFMFRLKGSEAGL